MYGCFVKLIQLLQYRPRYIHRLGIRHLRQKFLFQGKPIGAMWGLHYLGAKPFTCCLPLRRSEPLQNLFHFLFRGVTGILARKTVQRPCQLQFVGPQHLLLCIDCRRFFLGDGLFWLDSRLPAFERDTHRPNFASALWLLRWPSPFGYLFPDSRDQFPGSLQSLERCRHC